MIEVFDFEQGSPDWREARRGLPTASEFKTLIRTKGRGESGESVTRKKYLLSTRRRDRDRRTGRDVQQRTHGARAGHGGERALLLRAGVARARHPRRISPRYGQGRGLFTRQPGWRKGCSKIKTALPDIVIAHMLKGEFPPEHKAQTQGNLWISEREWIDLEIYWPSLPRPFEKRAARDEAYIHNLAASVAQFREELEQTVERVRRYGEPNAPTEINKARFRKSLAVEPVPEREPINWLRSG